MIKHYAQGSYRALRNVGLRKAASTHTENMLKELSKVTSTPTDSEGNKQLPMSVHMFYIPAAHKDSK